MKLVFDDPDLDGQLQRTVPRTASAWPAAGECLLASHRCQHLPGDTSTWYPEAEP